MWGAIATVFAALIAAVTAMQIARKFQRQNDEISNLHGESSWRADLFELTHVSKIDRESLELFRTCLSATRGIKVTKGLRSRLVKYDLNEAKRTNLDLDDICIQYYAGLNEKLILQDVITEDKLLISFRLLCRLLLKSDWNIRTSPENKEKVNSEIINKAEKIIKLLGDPFKCAEETLESGFKKNSEKKTASSAVVTEIVWALLGINLGAYLFYKFSDAFSIVNGYLGQLNILDLVGLSTILFFAVLFSFVNLVYMLSLKHKGFRVYNELFFTLLPRFFAWDVLIIACVMQLPKVQDNLMGVTPVLVLFGITCLPIITGVILVWKIDGLGLNGFFELSKIRAHFGKTN